jgi:hypothetical protein
MRKHNGMRPQDIAILVKIVSIGNLPWQLSVLSNSLSISVSEISESLNRSRFAKLIDYEKKKINRNNLMEFLEHGVKYVFPQQPGTMIRGIPTAHSHPFIKKQFLSELAYVWPDPKADVVGLSIEPFYPKQTQAAKEEPTFYKLMSLIDIIRVGKVREVRFAVQELEKQILHESSRESGKNKSRS